MLHLAVGGFEVDWGKNYVLHDYSALFQPGDACSVLYHSVSPFTDEIVVEEKKGFSKPLRDIIQRPNLLGYTHSYAEAEFEYLLESSRVDFKRFSFSEFSEALATVDVKSVEHYDNSEDNLGEYFRRHLFDTLCLGRHAEDPDYVRREAGAALENISAYSILQMLSRNPSSIELPVVWYFEELEEYGMRWRDNIPKPLDPVDRFLIVTEGSSDAKIIKHALSLIKPHLVDFFDFVDMNEGYPFSGTGNLHSFVKGLIGISVQNNVIVLYDNDAEGVLNFNRTVKLKTLSNMRILRLPDIDAFERFRTIGPTGEHISSINGRAASIECYLDVGRSATVRWTVFNRELGVYQGELVGKRDAMKTFLALSDRVASYDLSRICAVVEILISTCVEMKERTRIERLKSDL